MKSFLGMALVALLLLGVALLEPSDTEARSCYSIWAEADGSGSSYRHFVYVENDCDYWIECSVWTDVNPHPPRIISVAPSATESVETSGMSKYDDPRAFGTCREK
jgi:hypothetical protein